MNEERLRNCTFKFEAWQALEDAFLTEVKVLQEKSSGDLLQKLENLKKRLKQWAGQIQANRKKKKQVLLEKLAELAEADRDDKNLAELIDTKIYLNFDIEKDERYWKQRARLNWLKFENKNTVFFQSQASQLRRTNFIHRLQNEAGREMKALQGIEEAARYYFLNLFSVVERENYDHLMTGIDRCVYEEDNRQLTALYTKEEIQEAVFTMGPTKAPGEDGLLDLFYQKYWHIIGEEVTSFCLQLLNGDIEVSLINSTNIVLILKVSNPSNMMQFRPISLYNVLYKSLAKVIANRFRGVIEKCIDGTQSAFVPGRLISNNVLLAYETLYMLKHKRLGKKRYMAFKLDMSKVYDRVEQNFIREIMVRMGFDQKWVDALMKCVTIISYSVVIMGILGKSFYPQEVSGRSSKPIPISFMWRGFFELIKTCNK